MQRHEAVELLVDRIGNDLIGGAADMAKETAAALAEAAEADEAESAAAFREACLAAIERIIRVTPSIMPVTFVLHRVASALDEDDDVSELRRRTAAAAEEARVWIEGAVARVATVGGELLGDGERLFTYSISSTVFAIVRVARKQGKRISVVTTESRPGNEGLQTLDVMGELGVRVTVGIDAAVGALLKDCTSVMVGGDTITATGDALCKIGSFPTALAAYRYGIPFRVAADISKLDINSLSGVPLYIRQMPTSDVVPAEPAAHVNVVNPVFELVPHDLIDSLVTDVGVVHPAAAGVLMDRLPRSALVAERVAGFYRDEARAAERGMR